MSVEQEHIWLHTTMAAPVPLYNEPITIHRHGSFDLALFKQSFEEILRRHEIWRTSIQQVDGELVQIVHPELHVHFPHSDLTGLPAAEREAAAIRIATEEARRPFDFGKAPLLRGRVVRLSDDEHRLYLTLSSPHLRWSSIECCFRNWQRSTKH